MKNGLENYYTIDWENHCKINKKNFFVIVTKTWYEYNTWRAAEVMKYKQ